MINLLIGTVIIKKNWNGLEMVDVFRSPIDLDVEIIHSTYEDNPFLDKAYVKTLQDLSAQDENFYNIYTLGNWGRLEGKIYTNYEIIPELPKLSGEKFVYGLDFGDAVSTLVKVHLWENTFYLEERFYKTGWTNADIIEHLSHEERGDIYGDPTSKQAVKEIAQAGYFAFDGIKDVKASIDLCRRQKFYIPQGSVNLINEIRSYHRKKNPLATGQEDAFLEEPVKYRDHACDAFRYGVWGIVSRFGFPTQRPRSFEPIRALHFRR